MVHGGTYHRRLEMWNVEPFFVFTFSLIVLIEAMTLRVRDFEAAFENRSTSLLICSSSGFIAARISEDTSVTVARSLRPEVVQPSDTDHAERSHSLSAIESAEARFLRSGTRVGKKKKGSSEPWSNATYLITNASHK